MGEKVYKVWIQVERCDYDADEYENITEPIDIVSCDSAEEAFQWIEEVLNYDARRDRTDGEEGDGE